MKQGRTYTVPHRRRREGKTNYRQRLELLKSGKPRLVVRRSLDNTTCQVVRYSSRGDSVAASAHSMQLAKLGWLAHGSNLPSAYLTGLLCGSRAREAGVSECILDMGPYASTRGFGIYAALKGALDAGLKVSHSPDILPPEDRISGAHIAAWAEKLKPEKEKYQKTFSLYLKRGLSPENIKKQFEETKKKILSAKPAPKPLKPKEVPKKPKADKRETGKKPI
ncbi:MAG: 50S ribosomal protein L18 [Candidatus Aenigmatarchaeota archaeon]